MWQYINESFKKYPSQQKVLLKLISLGLSVRRDFEGVPRIYCSDVEVKASALASSLDIDRRAVLDALDKIVHDEKLAVFFANITPVPDFGKVSTHLGMGVIQILPESATKPGIIAGVSRIFSEEGISIRQVLVDDPELSESPKATIVTDGQIPSRLLSEIRKIPGVQAVLLL
ncbi:MAG: ACT domain-containing protein [Thermoplasmataceae archaeon]|jgi:predicted regulator of amino acid metabolism with ACT domain